MQNTSLKKLIFASFINFRLKKGGQDFGNPKISV